MHGRHINDHQLNLFMRFRKSDTVTQASGKAGFNRATGYRIAANPEFPSQITGLSKRRRPDPLEQIFDAENVPLLEAARGLRAIAV